MWALSGSWEDGGMGFTFHGVQTPVLVPLTSLSQIFCFGVSSVRFTFLTLYWAKVDPFYKQFVFSEASLLLGWLARMKNYVCFILLQC